MISAASKTPFESSRRVFVIERADELGDEAANRMLKTLEEPARFVHIILLTDRLPEILPTIRSRCQVVRFEAPSEEEAASELEAAGSGACHRPGVRPARPPRMPTGRASWRRRRVRRSGPPPRRSPGRHSAGG